MSNMLSVFLLLSVPVLPLMLALPALRSRLPWPHHLALSPAVILLLVPVSFSIDVPWLLFGTGLGIGEASRWLLAMSVALWAVAATFLHTTTDTAVDNRSATIFLLTMAGNLGAILATDLAGFFAFTTLMGYGFYGLLVAGGDVPVRRDGRAYLGCMILADLALFDALLIAAATTEDLDFEVIHHALGQSPESAVYLSMVLAGFALKAGVWPLHFWLPPAFRSARPTAGLLLSGVPVVIGLIGMVRWLPLGEITSTLPGLTIQGLGIAGMLYAILAGLRRAQLKMVPAYATMVATGLFVTGVGAGLADPAAWGRHADWAHIFIVSLGCGIAMLTVAVGWLEARRQFAAVPAIDSKPWIDRWSEATVRWATQMGVNLKRQFHQTWLAKLSHLRQVRVRAWLRALVDSERYLGRWPVAITLLLCIVVAFAGASVWN